MGRDKAGLQFNGAPLWHRQVNLLGALKPMEILVSARPTSVISGHGFPIILDMISGKGPLGGVAALLEHAQQPTLLVLAVDLPWMKKGFLKKMIERCPPDTGLVPEHDGVYEGLAAIYPKAALPIAKDLLQGEDTSLQRFAKECLSAGLIESVPIPEADLPLFRSVNSPSDLGPEFFVNDL